MSRKNRRIRGNQKLLPTIQKNMDQDRHKDRSRCAFCGRLLDYGEWHWMYDEFGQRVKKCNSEAACSRQRKDAAEESYRKATR
jgi:hypothetical protein